MRASQRTYQQLRTIQITNPYNQYAEGSVLIEFGATKVICTASVVPGVPLFLKDSGNGWVTAEYGMLPRATHDRVAREAAKGKQSGRTQEIQRLIGRSLRAALNLAALKDYTIIVDCDVIQADGGTRTASITGGCIALYEAIRSLQKEKKIEGQPFKQFIAAVSVGIHQGQPLLDLDYQEDVRAETDLNVVMTEHQQFIEIQGTAEKGAFSQAELNQMLELAQIGIKDLIKKQKNGNKTG